ncbi:hypothetical protein AKJ50_01310 [candidate division MSBL1 archaeon SCGC-AAA382A13]|uniref:DUF433 domain-containing protein n=1 Tax=candidate division MSBL1 archaeon SCGC-AAA382A13 TaxID=1698279 RepID=A0A133VFT7_9EURY|nr:hypothetical protein AKJ50_01310 [candidate division MSBL1 archaeon SCGC-AAA382A13]
MALTPVGITTGPETRTRVLDIVIAFEHGDLSPDEIVDCYPQLDLGDVHSALSYHYKNVEEIKETLRKKAP